MPIWSLYITFLLGAFVGVVVSPSPPALRWLGLVCMLAVFMGMTFARTADLGDDTSAYLAWANAVGQASNLSDATPGRRDPGFSIFLWMLNRLLGSPELTSLSLPLVAAGLGVAAAAAASGRWPLASTLLLQNRLFIDACFNFVRSTISAVIALFALNRFAMGGRLAWLLCFVPAYFLHSKEAILVATAAVLAAILPRWSVLWVIAAATIMVLVRTTRELHFLPAWLTRWPVLREFSRIELNEIYAKLIPASIALQVVIYVSAPLAVAVLTPQSNARQHRYFTALAATCLAAFAILGPELPLVLRVIPVALILASVLAAETDTGLMYIVRCCMIAANFSALVSIVQRAKIIVY